MSKSNKIIHAAIAASLAFGMAQASAHLEPSQDMSAMGNIEGMEKCYGIAKAHRNDCGTETHGCGGEAKIDGDKNEWMLVPTGLCQKIVGGSTKPSNEDKKKV